MTKWYVWQSGNDPVGDLTEHRTYKDAVLEAQSRGFTHRRPMRFGPGMYELPTEFHLYYIATAAALELNEFTDVLDAVRSLAYILRE